MEVVQLKPVADKEKESTIEVLEEMIKQAREGHIQSVGIAVLRPDGSTGTAWSDATASGLLAAISLLNHRLIKAIDFEDGD
jgi:hypothetical protein